MLIFFWNKKNLRKKIKEALDLLSSVSSKPKMKLSPVSEVGDWPLSRPKTDAEVNLRSSPSLLLVFTGCQEDFLLYRVGSQKNTVTLLLFSISGSILLACKPRIRDNRWYSNRNIEANLQFFFQFCHDVTEDNWNWKEK